MSSAMALAAVTATLQRSLYYLYQNPSSPLGTVNVAAIAPDLVETTYGTGPDATPVVNLFLHQVIPNAAWRNMDLPSLAADGATRLKNPPLALDLHYLLTAYSSDDTEAEALLGYAILMLHENPILPRALINTILATLPVDTYNTAIQNAGLSAQFEMIKLVPETMGREEMAWLWTALKSDYRPTFPFYVSVVLMRNDNPTAFSLPVLMRNINVQAGAPAQLFVVQPPYDQSGAVAGNTVQITGQSLSGASTIQLVNPTANVSYQFTPATGDVTDMLLSFAIPEDPLNMVCGVCQASLNYTDTTGNISQQTNAVTLGIGLTIASTPAPAASASGSGTAISLTCDPQVRPGQNVSLVVGQYVSAPQTITAATASLSFQFTPALPASASYGARLVVDGVVNPTAQNWSFTPPGTLTVLP